MSTQMGSEGFYAHHGLLAVMASFAVWHLIHMHSWWVLSPGAVFSWAVFRISARYVEDARR